MDPQELFFLRSLQNNTRSFKNTNSKEIKLNIFLKNPVHMQTMFTQQRDDCLPFTEPRLRPELLSNQVKRGHAGLWRFITHAALRRLSYSFCSLHI